METEYSMEHLGISESLRKNLKLQYYEAGHMMYVRDETSLNSKQRGGVYDSASKP